MLLVALYAHATADLKEMESTAQVRSSIDNYILAMGGDVPHIVVFMVDHCCIASF